MTRVGIDPATGSTYEKHALALQYRMVLLDDHHGAMGKGRAESNGH